MRLLGVLVCAAATMMAVGNPLEAWASGEDWGLIGTYTATSNGEWAKNNERFSDEASLRSRPRANDAYYRRHGLRGPELRTYNQSHAPVRDQREVVGHAVRAMYLYSAMADLAAETGDLSLRQACERLWSHLVSTRVYVTGGIPCV